jgi:hypothetical protein
VTVYALQVVLAAEEVDRIYASERMADIVGVVHHYVTEHGDAFTDDDALRILALEERDMTEVERAAWEALREQHRAAAS